MGKDERGDRKGQQPEALRTFGTAARSGSKKPDDQGYEAKPETAPKSASSERKQKAAAEVLQAGVEKDPKKARDAAKNTRSR